MVEVKKLRTFYDFCGACATLCGDSPGRCSKTADFLRFLQAARDPPPEIRVVDVKKLMTFLRFLACARDPLRRFAWSRLKNCGLFTISAVRARPSAEIRVVDVQKLMTFHDFCKPRATLCGDSRGRGSKTEDFFVSKRSRCGAVQFSCSRNGLWKFSPGLRAWFRNPAVAGSIPPWSAAAPA